MKNEVRIHLFGHYFTFSAKTEKVKSHRLCGFQYLLISKVSFRKLVSSLVSLSMIMALTSCTRKPHAQIIISSDSTRWEIYTDTFYLDIKDYIRPGTRVAVESVQKFHNKYYCFLSEQGMYSFRDDRDFFLILSEKGKVLKSIDVTKEFENIGNYDLVIHRDSLLVNSKYDSESMYFDENRCRWDKIPFVQRYIFEDQQYAISYFDHGEWGAKVIFKNKKTGKTTFTRCGGKDVIAWNDKYYLTSEHAILQVNDPNKMQPCPDDQKFGKLMPEQEPYVLRGEEFFYSQIFKFPSAEKIIEHKLITSFFAGNKLYHLFVRNDTNYIGIVEKTKLKPMLRILNGTHIYDYLPANTNSEKDDQSRLLVFKRDENSYGVLEIRDKQLHVHYLIHNQDSLPQLLVGYSE